MSDISALLYTPALNNNMAAALEYTGQEKMSGSGFFSGSIHSENEGRATEDTEHSETENSKSLFYLPSVLPVSSVVKVPECVIPSDPGPVVWSTG